MHDMAIRWATMLQKAILCLKLQSNTTTINLETMKMYSKWTIRYPLLTLGQLIRCKPYLAPVSFSFFFTRILFSQPRLNILIFPADFRLKIFLYYSLIEFKQKNIIMILFNLGVYFISFVLYTVHVHKFNIMMYHSSNCH